MLTPSAVDLSFFFAPKNAGTNQARSTLGENCQPFRRQHDIDVFSKSRDNHGKEATAPITIVIDPVVPQSATSLASALLSIP